MFLRSTPYVPEAEHGGVAAGSGAGLPRPAGVELAPSEECCWTDTGAGGRQDLLPDAAACAEWYTAVP